MSTQTYTKDQQIVRQSSIKASQEFFSRKGLDPSLTDVMLGADVIHSWVETGNIKRVREFDNHYLFDSLLEKLK